MVKYRKKHRKAKKRKNPSRKRRASRKRRSNPRRRKSRSRRRKNGGQWTGVHKRWGRVSGHKRNRKRIASHKRRTNPRRRRNPSLKSMIPSKSFVIQAASVVAGYLGGKLIMGQATKMLPQGAVGTYAPPVIALLLGAFLGTRPNPMMKAAGVGIAASGIATLISRFLPADVSGLLGTDLSDGEYDGDDGVVQIGDDVVRVGTDLSDDSDIMGDSVYEMM